jgi:hypothetical protein
LVAACILDVGAAASASGAFFLQTLIACASGAKSIKHKVQSMKAFFICFSPAA